MATSKYNTLAQLLSRHAHLPAGTAYHALWLLSEERAQGVSQRAWEGTCGLPPLSLSERETPLLDLHPRWAESIVLRRAVLSCEGAREIPQVAQVRDALEYLERIRPLILSCPLLMDNHKINECLERKPDYPPHNLAQDLHGHMRVAARSPEAPVWLRDLPGTWPRTLARMRAKAPVAPQDAFQESISIPIPPPAENLSESLAAASNAIREYYRGEATHPPEEKQIGGLPPAPEPVTLPDRREEGEESMERRPQINQDNRNNQLIVKIRSLEPDFDYDKFIASLVHDALVAHYREILKKELDDLG